MSDGSTIEWTDATWNPVRGCSRVSEGCRNCYAEKTAARFSGPNAPYEGLVDIGEKGPRWNGTVLRVPHLLGEPLRWRKPKRVFVNSMSDLFHPDVPFEFIAAVFGVMAAAPQHVFQILTKRPARMLEFFAWLDEGHEYWYPFGIECMKLGIGVNETMRRAIASHPRHSRSDTDLYWPLPNVWLGVSAENQLTADERIPLLLQCPAAVRFVSAEPLLGPIEFWMIRDGSWYDREGANLYNALRGTAYWSNGDHGIGGGPRLNWVIVGGESGPGARPCDVSWIRSIVEQCRAAEVPCFVKQLGSRSVGRVCDAEATNYGEMLSMGLRHSKGGDLNEWPSDLSIREFPEVRR